MNKYFDINGDFLEEKFSENEENSNGLEELDGLNEEDIFDEKIVELKDENDTVSEYYFLGNLEKDGVTYVFLQPDELTEEETEDNIIVLKVFDGGKELELVTDNDLLSQLEVEFNALYKGEYNEDEYLN